MAPVPDPKTIHDRIGEWQAQLVDLYSRVEALVSKRSDAKEITLMRGSILPPYESPVEQAGISPTMVPTLALIRGTKRVSFVPAGLFAAPKGTFGRINLTTNHHQFPLISTIRTAGPLSHWLVLTSIADSGRPFGGEILNQLIDHETIR